MSETALPKLDAPLVLVHGLCGFDRLYACRRTVKEYFPGVPLRKPAAELDSLIDYSVITRETDWEPLDQSLPKPPPVKPSVWIHIKRLLKHSLT